MTYENGKINVFILNLLERPDRKTRTIDELSRQTWVNNITIINSDRDKDNPMRACTESHIKALLEIERSGTIGLIVEDDIRFTKDSNNLLGMLKELNEWDLILLGCTTVIDEKLPNPFSKSFVTLPGMFTGSHAVLINPNIITNLLMELAFYENYIDWGYGEATKSLRLNSYIIRPFLVSVYGDEKSSIRDGPVDDAEIIKLTEDILLNL